MKLVSIHYNLLFLPLTLDEPKPWMDGYLIKKKNFSDAQHTSKAVLDNLRSSALELCDLYLAPTRPSVMGIPDNCHAELVRKITTEGEEFTNNPVACFDDVQKCVCDALEVRILLKFKSIYFIWLSI